MLATVVLSLLAGFFAGNGLPYYVAGSTGEGTNPSPFPDRPVVNVLSGCAWLAIAGVCWSAADVRSHKLAAWLAALAGAASVGIIHARLWRNDPWKKHTRDAGVAAPKFSEPIAPPSSHPRPEDHALHR